MEQQTLGKRIAELRKEHNMTQLELAEEMGVTDKAVSKWERDLACPDINTLPKLAALFGVSVDELMQGNAPVEPEGQSPLSEMITLVLKAVTLAMGVGVAALSVMGKLSPEAAMPMLGLGLACVGCVLLRENQR